MWNPFKRKTPIAAEKTFPTTLTVGNITITLNGDGSWSGDGEAFMREIEACTRPQGGYKDETRTMTWLVANAIRNSK